MLRAVPPPQQADESGRRQRVEVAAWQRSAGERCFALQGAQRVVRLRVLCVLGCGKNSRTEYVCLQYTKCQAGCFTGITR